MSGRAGSVAVLVLFLTAALMLIASALWRGAGAGYLDARSRASALQARLAAESAIGRTIGVGGPLPGVPAGVVGALPGVTLVPGTPGVRSVVSTLRATRELYRLEATGIAGRPAAHSSVAYLLWRLDPGTRLRALGAVAALGGAVRVSPGGAISGGGVGAPPSPWAAPQCALHQSLADSVFPSGIAPVSKRDTTTALRLGMLDHAELLSRGSAVSGVGTPLPRVAGGVCATASSWNWGSPTAPGGPCGSHRPLIFATGDLVVSGGEGQGVLVVDGTIRLTAGARYYGLVVARGDVFMDQGAQLDGMVRAGGDISVGPTSALRGSVCPVLLGLNAVPFGSAVAVPHGWVDPF